jgi:uncharacterized protein YodC (DUF2158 family)
MWTLLKKWVFGPDSCFKCGDTVELKDGSHLMQVIEVMRNRKLKEALIQCKWYEPETKETRTNIFRESRLKFFDWYKSHENTLPAKSTRVRPEVMVKVGSDL